MNLPFAQPGRDDPGSAYDARPIVAIRRQDRSAWRYAGGAIVAAILLFTALEARRRGVEQAETQSAPASAFANPEAIPELVVPNMPPDPAAFSAPWAQPGDARQPRSLPMSIPQTRISPMSEPPQPYASGSPYLVSPSPPQPPVEIESLSPRPQSQALEGPPSSAAAQANGKRIMAGRLQNPATTVVQGTLVNAVMETALDSTSPGQTRAVVTRDVHGFDGTRILIPRGSRLYGVYEANVAQGQNRAQIRWTRLLRPDGVSVALDSPAADPLGRAGVAAKVNNHFFQRLGNALIGTTANVGSALVTNGIGNSPVVVAVPSAAQTATQAVVPSSNQIMPTLTVRQGTRITVFVQHDLDFSSVDGVP